MPIVVVVSVDGTVEVETPTSPLVLTELSTGSLISIAFGTGGDGDGDDDGGNGNDDGGAGLAINALNIIPS